MSGDREMEFSLHVDVAECYRGDAREMIGPVSVWISIDNLLHGCHVPSHDDVRQQYQCPGNGGNLTEFAALLGFDRAAPTVPLAVPDVKATRSYLAVAAANTRGAPRR